MSLRSFIDNLRIIVYFVLTAIVLIVSFFPEGIVLYYFLTTIPPDIIQCLLIPLYFFVSYCFTVLFFGVIHSQLVVKLVLPSRIEPGEYHGSKGRLVAVRITADGIFKSMLKFFAFLPFFWGLVLFPYGLRLYGLKCGKNVYIATKTYIESAGLVEIGDNSFIGYNSMIMAHTCNNRTVVVTPTKIGKNTVIGTYAIVEPGVEVGDYSILGAKSVFRNGQRVPANEIWVGAPARLLKERKSKDS